jgi:hypothetical protein
MPYEGEFEVEEEEPKKKRKPKKRRDDADEVYDDFDEIPAKKSPIESEKE